MFLNISDTLRNKAFYLKTLLGLSCTLPEFFDSFLLLFALETTKYGQFVTYISLYYFAIDRNIHSYKQIGYGLKQRGNIIYTNITLICTLVLVWTEY